MYILVMGIASLSTIQDLILKGKTSYVSLLISLVGIICIIYLIKTRQRFAYGFGILYSGAEIILSLTLFGILLFNINDLSITLLLGNNELLLRVLFSFIRLLPIREKEALETLDQLSKKEGTVADNAKNIAKSWRDGDQGLLKVLGK
jgi:hypothetical protein